MSELDLSNCFSASALFVLIPKSSSRSSSLLSSTGLGFYRSLISCIISVLLSTIKAYCIAFI
nr:MAG TPA: hypothetical protein [Bacteriophage sp.]